MAGKIGGGGHKRGALSPNSEPNVIPFIDIMLVMLIIFMVAAPPPTVDIKVDLPPPGKPVYIQPTDKPTVVVLLDNGGVLSIVVGGEATTQQAFESTLLRVAQQNNPSYQANLGVMFAQAKIYVDASQDTSYDNVVSLINQIDTVGFKQVSLLVKEAQS